MSKLVHRRQTWAGLWLLLMGVSSIGLGVLLYGVVTLGPLDVAEACASTLSSTSASVPTGPVHVERRVVPLRLTCRWTNASPTAELVPLSSTILVVGLMGAGALCLIVLLSFRRSRAGRGTMRPSAGR